MLLNCGVGEDSWESLGQQGDPASTSEGNQSWMFIGRTDAEAETPIVWPPDAKNWLICKDPDAGKDWRQEKRMTEDEIVGWHHRLNTWVWVNSGSWWWKGKPGMLQSMGSHRVGHDWATELRDLGRASQVALVVKNLPASARDIRAAGTIPGWGRFPGGRHDNPLQSSIIPSTRVFSNESFLCSRCPNYWSFSFSISPSNEYSGLISFRMD